MEAAQADPARFEALYRKYLAQVYNYAFYELRDHHEAEDATERTFLAALTNLPVRGARAPGRRRGRLHVPGLALPDRAERRRRTPPPRAAVARDALEAPLTVPAAVDLEAEVARHDEAAAAWRAVARLPDDRRRAVVLRFVDEMSTAEIAGVLGRSEGAVRVLIHRALRSVAARPRRPDADDRRVRRPRRDEIDALVTDRYLDALLAAHARGAERRPAVDRPGRRDPAARRPPGARPAAPPSVVPVRGGARRPARRGRRDDARRLPPAGPAERPSSARAGDPAGPDARRRLGRRRIRDAVSAARCSSAAR